MSTCRYCKREDDHTICLYCDGRHSARDIHRRVLNERSLPEYSHKNNIFKEDKVKAFLIARDILGLKGLTREDRDMFFSAFNAKYKDLKAREFLGQP